MLQWHLQLESYQLLPCLPRWRVGCNANSHLCSCLLKVVDSIGKGGISSGHMLTNKCLLTGCGIWGHTLLCVAVALLCQAYTELYPTSHSVTNHDSPLPTLCMLVQNSNIICLFYVNILATVLIFAIKGCCVLLYGTVSCRSINGSKVCAPILPICFYFSHN